MSLADDLLRLALCPNAADHAKDEPEGYIAWHAWAERKARTHEQKRCPGCGLYVVWTARQQAES